MLSDFEQIVFDMSLSAMENFKRTREGVRIEVIEDSIYVSPSPTTDHQEICERIFLRLSSHVMRFKLGRMSTTPVDTFLNGRKTAVVPDIVFISKHNKKLKVEMRGYFGPPDLTIEVLSPSNRKYDLTTKKKVYERAGVREYWVIDPETKEAEGFRLRKGRYGKPLLMTSKIHIRILNHTVRF